MASKAIQPSAKTLSIRAARRSGSVETAEFIVICRRRIAGVEKGGVVELPLNGATQCLIEAHAIELKPKDKELEETPKVESSKATTPPVKKGPGNG